MSPRQTQTMASIPGEFQRWTQRKARFCGWETVSREVGHKTLCCLQGSLLTTTIKYVQRDGQSRGHRPRRSLSEPVVRTGPAELTQLGSSGEERGGPRSAGAHATPHALPGTTQAAADAIDSHSASPFRKRGRDARRTAPARRRLPEGPMNGGVGGH